MLMRRISVMRWSGLLLNRIEKYNMIFDEILKVSPYSLDAESKKKLLADRFIDSEMG